MCLEWIRSVFQETIDLKNKQKWVYSGISENCNSGHKNCGKTIGKSREQRRGMFFCRGKGELRGAVINRVHWRELGIQSVVAFH